MTLRHEAPTVCAVAEGDKAMTSDRDRDVVVDELEALRQRLDESLLALTGRVEHVPMHDVMGGLLSRVSAQHAEIQDLRRQLAECLHHRS